MKLKHFCKNCEIKEERKIHTQRTVKRTGGENQNKMKATKKKKNNSGLILIMIKNNSSFGGKKKRKIKKYLYNYLDNVIIKVIGAWKQGEKALYASLFTQQCGRVETPRPHY